MKNFLIRTLAGITVVCGATVGLAQQAASAAGTGTVTGHVTCGDTQRPARFASVTLFGVPVEVKAVVSVAMPEESVAVPRAVVPE